MLLFTECENGELVQREYAEAEYALIRKEADAYHIVKSGKHVEGYGYGQTDSEPLTVSDTDISDENLIVKDGHFAGCRVAFTEEFSVRGEIRSNTQIHVLDVRDVPDDRAYAMKSDDYSTDDHDNVFYEYFHLRKKQ